MYEWKATCLMYNSLNIYSKLTHTIQMHTWWVVTQRVPHIYKQVSAVMAVIMGSQPSSMQRNFDHKFCQLCDGRASDNVLHVLFNCEALAPVRDRKLNAMYNSMPSAMINTYQIMNENEKAIFLLSPLSCKFISEWLNIYEAIANMVFGLYSTRSELYDDLVSHNGENRDNGGNLG